MFSKPNLKCGKAGPCVFTNEFPCPSAVMLYLEKISGIQGHIESAICTKSVYVSERVRAREICTYIKSRSLQGWSLRVCKLFPGPSVVMMYLDRVSWI